MASLSRTVTINEVPEGRGKEVLRKILNSSKADRQKLRKVVHDYERRRLMEVDAGGEGQRQ
ncbi:MAG: hypothetical protein IKA80_04075 [Spirochaetaceae bacterium]|nr:hypothetical protein [Spirochaetaceae bacterium]MBQ7367077.1 hypothetical protein [Spirochaetaceae bacterium]MBQ8560202.1 hypothetical protein [Spirochaetaceae bacterium]MBR2361803.1 hypothetical protein [Spirochaetaceae bacterium]MBR2462914.1 hypothetical protein [Spirochaetaceae bacterium]